MDAIILENVEKKFQAQQAVDSLSVSIPEGSIYGFLGPNGAGKTTTLRMIMNIIRPDAGKIRLFGNPFFSPVKHRIGYLPEERGLYRKMTVENILGYFGSIQGLSRSELARQIPVWLKRVDLENARRKKVEELSKGMHQKLQFAVTCIHEPDLLILDEPFSGLDPVNLDVLKEILLEFHRQGKTILFSTHIMEQAERICDYILLINKGKAVLNESMKSIRSRRSPNTAIVELEEDAPFPDNLVTVESANGQDQKWVVQIRKEYDTQPFLQELASRVRIVSFEVKAPSLHDLFIELAGQHDS